jgi:hypothetical protein
MELVGYCPAHIPAWGEEFPTHSWRVIMGLNYEHQSGQNVVNLIYELGPVTIAEDKRVG